MLMNITTYNIYYILYEIFIFQQSFTLIILLYYKYFSFINIFSINNYRRKFKFAVFLFGEIGKMVVIRFFSYPLSITKTSV